MTLLAETVFDIRTIQKSAQQLQMTDTGHRPHSLSVKQHGNKQVRWLGVWHNPMWSDHWLLFKTVNVWCLYSIISGTFNQFTKRCYTKYRYSSNLEVYELVNSVLINSKQLVWTRPLLFCDIMQHWLVDSDQSLGQLSWSVGN